MKEWILKLMELTEMAKLTALLTDSSLTTFHVIWRPLLDFLQDKEKNQLLNLGFEDCIEFN